MKLVQILAVKYINILNKLSTVGYIQLSGFSADVESGIHSAIIVLYKRGFMKNRNRLQVLVLDLHWYPGRLLILVVDVASVFT